MRADGARIVYIRIFYGERLDRSVQAKKIQQCQSDKGAVMFNGAEFNRNVSQQTPEELAPYVEQHVAWSRDGKRILAHASDLDGLLKEIDRLELKDYVFGFIPDTDQSNIGELH
jgi:hypothetical protein